MFITWILAGLFLMSGSNLLNQPESVVYDAEHDRYLVSNCGDGNIILIHRLGAVESAVTPAPRMEVFYTGLPIAVGLHIRDGVVYTASQTRLVGIDLKTRQMVVSVDIAEALFLNDVTSDDAGYLYVTDSEAFKLFKVDPKTQTYSVFVDQGIKRCNGVLHDPKHNRLLICTDNFDAKIFGVDLTDGTVSLVYNTLTHYLDGLVFDKKGYLYASSWFNHSIYRFDPGISGPAVRMSKNHQGPADIGYCGIDDELLVPNYTGDKVRFVKVRYCETVK